jgi:hypothetical protein
MIRKRGNDKVRRSGADARIDPSGVESFIARTSPYFSFTEGLMGQERDHQPALLNLADMIGPVSHELRNVFNNMVLTAAVLTRAVPEELRGQVAEFRSLALRANEMLTLLDHYRQAIVASRGLVDLNEAVEEAVNQCRANGLEVANKTSTDLPPVWAGRADVLRLIELLVSACRPPVQVCTERTGSAVRLTVQAGPPPNGESFERFFDAFGPAGSGKSQLERAACQTIARRLGVTLRTEKREGGMAVFIDFDPADNIS